MIFYTVRRYGAPKKFFSENTILQNLDTRTPSFNVSVEFFILILPTKFAINRIDK